MCFLNLILVSVLMFEDFEHGDKIGFNHRPQVTIATAIIFCHRFFLRQSHAKNDRRVCICQFGCPILCFVSGKGCMFLKNILEFSEQKETPFLKKVFILNYWTVHFSV